eukprot:6255142-Alexandrium_andersonii.AAC.1
MSSSISGASGPPAWPMPPQRGKSAGAGVTPPAPVAPVSAGVTLLAVLAAVNEDDLVSHVVGHGVDPELDAPEGSAAARLSGLRWAEAHGLERLVALSRGARVAIDQAEQ